MQVAFYFTRSETYSKDIVQDVFLKIWNSRERLADIEYLDAWVATIARNFTITALNKLAREEVMGERYADHLPNIGSPGSHTKLDYSELEQYMQQALQQLSEQQQRIFKMAKLEGLSRETIADQLQISPNTVKVHLLRATRFVRGYLLQKLDYLTFLLLAVFYSL